MTVVTESGNKLESADVEVMRVAEKSKLLEAKLYSGRWVLLGTFGSADKARQEMINLRESAMNNTKIYKVRGQQKCGK